MSCLFLTDCLNEVFENLEDDKFTLHSCLLVNRLWCKISVRILWRDILNFKDSLNDKHRSKVRLSILSTLFACLPNGSKEFYMRIEFSFQYLLQNHHYLIMHHLQGTY